MAKQKSFFTCSNCDFQSIKWLGCCPECREWESLVETTSGPVFGGAQQAHRSAATGSLPLCALDAVQPQNYQRMLAGIEEWDRVVGNGIVPGAFMIVTGDPGIGKSTLLLQVAEKISATKKVFYFSSEESLEQVKGRAERLGIMKSTILFSDQTNIEGIIATVQEHKPDLVIIDSIQNCYFSDARALPGTVGQLRESAFHLMRLAKDNQSAIILTGHITKDGSIAGPKTLEHMVDTVLYLQEEDRWQTRILRAVKNRFGAVHELGFFQMHANGLQEMPNINQQLLKEFSYAPGSALIGSIEGSRSLLLELQALTIPSKFGIPQRVVTGLDQKRVMLIGAILEKYLRIKFSEHDVFFKVSGGAKIREAASDLGIALALLSSYFQQPLPEKSLALGELSLTGQIKPVNQIGFYLAEAQKFGIEKFLIAKNQQLEKGKWKGACIGFHNVYELLSLFSEGSAL